MSTPANISAALGRTIAENIARRLDDDGNNFADRLTGTSLHDMALQHGGFRTYYRGSLDTDTQRWKFPDGSAIITVPGAWDLVLNPDDPQCFCMAGNGAHMADCHA